MIGQKYRNGVYHTSSSWVVLWETPSRKQALNLDYIHRRSGYLGEDSFDIKLNKPISNDATEIQIVRCAVVFSLLINLKTN